jgi:hypothetical protein
VRRTTTRVRIGLVIAFLLELPIHPGEITAT